MPVDEIIAYDDQHPSHRLGQYNAWRLHDHPTTPFDLIWVSIARADKPMAHRVLPHGEPSLAIRRRRDRDGDVKAIALTVCGPLRKAMWYHPEAREELIAIRLKPEMAAHIYGVSPGDYFDQPPASAPAALAAACAGTLRLAETGSPLEIAERLAGDLCRWAASHETRQTPEIAAAAILRKLEGRARCADLAKRLEISERHLRRRFRDHLGCSPKFYARQLRLTAAALMAETSPAPVWAQIAAATGFHDQAHMINEFRSMAHLTPRQFHTERTALSGFSNTLTKQ